MPNVDGPKRIANHAVVARCGDVGVDMQTKLEMDRRLAEAFGFGADELAVNRASILTDGQRDYLRRGVLARRRLGRLAVIVSLLSVLVIFGIALSQLPASASAALQAQLPLIYGSYAAVGGLVIVITLGSIILAWRRSDIRSGKVSVVEGEASPTMKKFTGRLQGVTAYYLEIGGMKFQFALRKQYEAFETGTYYRLFYVKDPPTHIVLSGECIE